MEPPVNIERVREQLVRMADNVKLKEHYTNMPAELLRQYYEAHTTKIKHMKARQALRKGKRK